MPNTALPLPPQLPNLRRAVIREANRSDYDAETVGDLLMITDRLHAQATAAKDREAYSMLTAENILRFYLESFEDGTDE